MDHLSAGDGTYEGKRLISAENMREMRTPQTLLSPDGEIPKVFFPDSMQLSYGLGWFVQDYRGHQLIIHAGDIDGFATMVVLIPEIHTGYFAVINMGSLYRQVLSYQIADRLLHLSDAAWSERFKKLSAELRAEEKAGEAWQLKRAPGTHPSRELSAYAGQYQNPAYGNAEIGFQKGKLGLHLQVTCGIERRERAERVPRAREACIVIAARVAVQAWSRAYEAILSCPAANTTTVSRRCRRSWLNWIARCVGTERY